MANVDMNEDLQEKVKEKRNPKGRREAANLKNPPRLRSGKEIKDLRKEFHTLADQVDEEDQHRDLDGRRPTAAVAERKAGVSALKGSELGRESASRILPIQVSAIFCRARR